MDPERRDSALGGASERLAFSVVLPAFDEEQGLSATLESLRAVLRRCDRPYEIVVVDDGSTDGTRRILDECPDVTVVRHGENRGYGAALKAGIAAARHPLVVVMDADGTYDAAAIPDLVERCTAADMVVGARLGPRVHSAPARSAAKWCFRQFAQWITRASIPDLNSGLRVFRRTVAERFLTLLPDGFSFTTTITVASLLEGFAVRFAVVDYMPRIGRSKVRPVRDTLRIARQLLRLGALLAPLRTALAIALVPCLVGIAASAYDLFHLGHVGPGAITALAGGVVLIAVGAGAEKRVERRRSLASAGLVTSRSIAA